MSINPLNHHYAMENSASIYDEEALTALELAGRTTAKVNEVVKAQNQLKQDTLDHLDQQDQNIDQRLSAQDNRITKMNNEAMPAKVTEEVQRKINSGEFAEEIDRYAGNLSDRVDNLLGQVSQGGTSMDAEVIDIRTPVEGSTHTSAGGAVRAVENKVIDLRNRADGGFTCFHNDWDKLRQWAGDLNLPSCITTEDGSLKWYYVAGMGGDPGVSVPVVRMPGAKHVYVDFDLSKVAGDNTLSVWVASKRGYDTETCMQIAVLDNPQHYKAVLSVNDYPFDINYIWLIAHSDAETGYTKLWIKVENLVIYTNTLQDGGFSGHTVEAHLLELKKGVDNMDKVGTHLIADGYSKVNNGWDDTVGLPSWAHQSYGVISWSAGGDNGLGIIFPKAVDPTKLLRIEFDLETTCNSIDVYTSTGKDLNDGYRQLGHITGPGHYSYIIDPAYADVYQGGIPKSFQIMSHGQGAIASVTVKNLRIFQNAVLDAGGKESIEANIISLYNRETEPIVTQNTATVTAPDGLRYLVQVDNSGAPVCVPVVPKKVLYVGNSLLSGFGHGMAASAPDKDYYYLMNQCINSKRSGLSASKLSGSDWEGMTSLLDKNTWNNNTLAPHLSADLDLVIIQLGDNVNTDAKKAVLLEGAKDLLRFIRNKCPKTRVVWAGSWYGSGNLADISSACSAVGCQFINFIDLHTTGNESAVGNTWTDASGKVTEITSSGVASHPGDSGMKAIANRLLYALGITETESYYT